MENISKPKFTMEEIRARSAPLARKYGVKKLALFGSYAGNRAGETSDIDFLVEKGEITGLWEFAGFVMELESAFGVPVDVLTYDSIDDAFMGIPIQNEVVLYEG